MAISNIVSGVGFRNLRVFALDANGYIAAPSTLPYEGLLVSGVKNFDVTDPEPRLFTHVGDDGPFALDILPPTEALTGKLMTAKQNDTFDALITGTNAFTTANINLFGVGTDKRGYENTVGAIAYRQTLDTDPTSAEFGARRWQFKILPKAIFFFLENSFAGDATEERSYTVRPAYTTKHLWGTPFGTTEGFNRAQLIRGIAQYKPKLVAFLADGIEDTFLFPATAQAANVANVSVWLDGVLQVDGVDITITTASIVFAGIPAIGQNITVLYEVA